MLNALFALMTSPRRTTQSTSAAKQVRGHRAHRRSCLFYSPCTVLTTGGPWKPALICTDCIEQLIESQYHAYTHKLANPSCAAEQRRLLNAGPPVNVSVRGLFCWSWGCGLDLGLGLGLGGRVVNGALLCKMKCDDGVCSVVQERLGLPCDAHGEDDKVKCEVQKLWYSADATEHSPKLDGSLEGEARMAYWNEQRSFIIASEKDGEGEGEGEGSGTTSAAVDDE